MCVRDGNAYAFFFYQFVVIQLLSQFLLFVTPWTVAHQAPLCMGSISQHNSVDYKDYSEKVESLLHRESL